MTWLRLVNAELRKLRSTKMPWAFLAVLAGISAITGIAVVFGTDMDGSKAFVSTAEDQRSLVAFAANALMGAGLFGAIAVAREYGHNTVVPTFLAEPRRYRAVLAQYVAVAMAGAVLSFIGAALTMLAVAVTLPTTEYGFLVPAGDVMRVLAASAFAGAAGAILGAGIGAVVRNTGGAVTVTVGVLIIVPPLLIQLANETASWIPNTLANVVSGVGTETSVVAALLAIAGWALVPALIGLAAVQKRDVI
jgi:ABC-2 type transport system permease protein